MKKFLTNLSFAAVAIFTASALCALFFIACDNSDPAASVPSPWAEENDAQEWLELRLTTASWLPLGYTLVQKANGVLFCKQPTTTGGTGYYKLGETIKTVEAIAGDPSGTIIPVSSAGEYYYKKITKSVATPTATIVTVPADADPLAITLLPGYDNPGDRFICQKIEGVNAVIADNVVTIDADANLTLAADRLYTVATLADIVNSNPRPKIFPGQDSTHITTVGMTNGRVKVAPYDEQYYYTTDGSVPPENVPTLNNLYGFSEFVSGTLTPKKYARGSATALASSATGLSPQCFYTVVDLGRCVVANNPYSIGMVYDNFINPGRLYTFKQVPTSGDAFQAVSGGKVYLAPISGGSMYLGTSPGPLTSGSYTLAQEVLGYVRGPNVPLPQDVVTAGDLVRIYSRPVVEQTTQSPFFITIEADTAYASNAQIKKVVTDLDGNLTLNITFDAKYYELIKVASKGEYFEFP